MERGKIVRMLLSDGYHDAAEYVRSLEAQLAQCKGQSMAAEVCPHCESRIAMQWDTASMGYRAFCPVCGRRIMRCAECLQEGARCDYCAETDSCRHNPVNDDDELAYLTEYLRESCFDDEISRDRLRMLWTAYCMHSGIDVNTARYNALLLRLWEELLETGNGTSDWSDSWEFTKFMCAYLM